MNQPDHPSVDPDERERRVLVLDVDGSELGLGTYVADEPVPMWQGRRQMTTPKIELDSGRIIYGYECWWTDAV